MSLSIDELLSCFDLVQQFSIFNFDIRIKRHTRHGCSCCHVVQLLFTGIHFFQAISRGRLGDRVVRALELIVVHNRDAAIR